MFFIRGFFFLYLSPSLYFKRTVSANLPFFFFRKKIFFMGILIVRDFTSNCTLMFRLLGLAEVLLVHLDIRIDNRRASTSGNGTVRVRPAPIRTHKFSSSPLPGLSHHWGLQGICHWRQQQSKTQCKLPGLEHLWMDYCAVLAGH